MSVAALTAISDSPALEAYLGELEERLEVAVGSCRGIVAEVGAEALAAGGKRLRPLLVYLSSPSGPPDCPPLLAPGGASRDRAVVISGAEPPDPTVRAPCEPALGALGFDQRRLLFGFRLGGSGSTSAGCSPFATGTLGF